MSHRFYYLTLTSVVFEPNIISWSRLISNKFNFNKCCIWTRTLALNAKHLNYLTLTSVVFELSSATELFSVVGYLTLTSVVFELGKDVAEILGYSNLTLTSVVFEQKILIKIKNLR